MPGLMSLPIPIGDPIMSVHAEMAQGDATQHRCQPTRGAGTCPPVVWHFADMRGASDFSRCEFSVELHANFSDGEGWEWQRQLPAIVTTAAVCEVRAYVRGLLHEGQMFAGADEVHVWAVRI